MRTHLFKKTSIAGALVLTFGSVFADPASPKTRSFRPLVPIRQNVESTSTTASVNQTISVKIPSPAFPAETSSSAESLSSDPASLPAANLPPTPVTDSKAAVAASELAPTKELNEADHPPAPPKAAASEKSEDSLPPEPVKTTAPTRKASAKDGPTLSRLRQEAHKLAGKGLKYSFGADDPKSGGLDCSSAMQYVLQKIGIPDVPRTSYDQYDWLKENKTLDDVYGKDPTKKLMSKLSPGDLIFWGGTYDSGHKVSHVMLYLGYDAKADKHYVFGAQSGGSKGLLGNGVDIFELNPTRGRLVGHGKIPGLIYE
jgi:peptidoglycan DL-endopeptidase CwlO